jgi:hypothetical protein
MPGPIQRNSVVRFFGQPDSTEGSVNEPRIREENGMHFNEKWTYRRPANDPAGAIERTVYWQRYDFVGSVIRTSADGGWQLDERLPAVLVDR